jgi:hypothetical protein
LGRLRRPALVREVLDHVGGSKRFQVAALRDPARGRELLEPLQELLGAQRRAQLDPNATLARPLRVVAMRRTRRDDDRLADPEDAVAAVHRHPQRPGDDLVPLRLFRMHVALGREAARPARHVVLEQPAAGLGRRLPELDSHPEQRQVEDVTGLRHRGRFYEPEPGPNTCARLVNG